MRFEVRLTVEAEASDDVAETLAYLIGIFQMVDPLLPDDVTIEDVIVGPDREKDPRDPDEVEITPDADAWGGVAAGPVQ